MCRTLRAGKREVARTSTAPRARRSRRAPRSGPRCLRRPASAGPAPRARRGRRPRTPRRTCSARRAAAPSRRASAAAGTAAPASAGRRSGSTAGARPAPGGRGSRARSACEAVERREAGVGRVDHRVEPRDEVVEAGVAEAPSRARSPAERASRCGCGRTCRRASRPRRRRSGAPTRTPKPRALHAAGVAHERRVMPSKVVSSTSCVRLLEERGPPTCVAAERAARRRRRRAACATARMRVVEPRPGDRGRGGHGRERQQVAARRQRARGDRAAQHRVRVALQLELDAPRRRGAE